MKKMMMLLPLILGLGVTATAGASTVLDTGPVGIGQDESARLVIKSAPPDDGPVSVGLTCRVHVEAPLVGGVKPKPLTYLLRPGQIQTVDITPETVYAATQPITAPKVPPRWYVGGRVTVDANASDLLAGPTGDLLCRSSVSGRVEVLTRTTGEIRATHDLNRQL